MATKTKKNVDWFSTIMTIVLVLLLVGGIILFAFQTFEKSGIGLRMKTVAKSENFKINGAMMQYAVITSYNNYLTQYEQFGMLDYLGIDRTKKLSEQQYSETQTWLDFFIGQAKTTVEQMLIYAEAANAAGYELTEDDKNSIDSTIGNYELMASYYGTSTDAYIASSYGQGVKAKDIRDFLEISALAERYSADMATELEDSIKEEDVNNYYEENKIDYTQFDTISYSEKLTIETEGKTEEEIAAAKEEFKNSLIKLTEAKTAEEFKAILAEIKGIETETEDAGDAEAQTADEETSNDTETPDDLDSSDDAKAPDDTSEETTETEDEKKEEEKTALDDVKEVTVSYGEVSGDISEWMFEEVDGAFVRANGDSKLFEENKENKGTGEEADVVKSHDYTVTVYVLLSDAGRDDSATKDVGHILFKTETYGTAAAALTEAEKILAEYNKGEKTKDSFEALGEKYTEDSSVFYENVREGDMVESFNDWLFSADRKTGDVEIVETEYGQHIMYYVGDGKAAWYADCYDAYFNKIAEDKYEEFKAAYAVKYNEKAAKAINC